MKLCQASDYTNNYLDIVWKVKTPKKMLFTKSFSVSICNIHFLLAEIELYKATFRETACLLKI